MYKNIHFLDFDSDDFLMYLMTPDVSYYTTCAVMGKTDLYVKEINKKRDIGSDLKARKFRFVRLFRFVLSRLISFFLLLF